MIFGALIEISFPESRLIGCSQIFVLPDARSASVVCFIYFFIFLRFLRISIILFDFLSQVAHWSLRRILGSQMLPLAKKWSTPTRLVKKLIFLDFLDFV